MRAINVGGIPSIYFSDDPIEDLRAYCGNYLQLEIQAEGLVRGVEPFSRFLTAAALACGQQVVFERLASDAAVPARTVREYFQVLEDTLLGSLLQPFTPKRASRKPVSHAKFYLFDVGVANVLAGITRIEAGSAAFGRALTGLRRLAEEVPLRRRIVVCGESVPRIVDGIELLPVTEFLAALWDGEILNERAQ